MPRPIGKVLVKVARQSKKAKERTMSDSNRSTDSKCQSPPMIDSGMRREGKGQPKRNLDEVYWRSSVMRAEGE